MISENHVYSNMNIYRNKISYFVTDDYSVFTVSYCLNSFPKTYCTSLFAKAFISTAIFLMFLHQLLFFCISERIKVR